MTAKDGGQRKVPAERKAIVEFFVAGRAYRPSVSVRYPWLKTLEIKYNVPLQSQAAPCVGFQFHREWGGVANPITLTPGQYYVTAQVLIGGQTKQKSVWFFVDKCTFNPNVQINF